MMNQERKKLLLQAAHYTWWASAGMTILYLKDICKVTVSPNPYIYWPVGIVLGLVVQHILTMVESTITSGDIPAPWNIDWRKGDRGMWLCLWAYTCLLIDGLLNFGGVKPFLDNLHAVNGLETIPVGLALVIQSGLTALFSLFLALGPELLRELAESGSLTTTEQYGFVPPALTSSVAAVQEAPARQELQEGLRNLRQVMEVESLVSRNGMKKTRLKGRPRV